MKRLLVVYLLICCVLMTSCQQEIVEEGISTGEAITTISTEKEELVEETAPSTLPYTIDFSTRDYASIGLRLAKGETFSARLYLNSDLIFYVLAPSKHRIFDAGRIEGTFEFTLTSNKSGTYIMNFVDDRGHCFITMEHDYEGDFWDYSR